MSANAAVTAAPATRPSHPVLAVARVEAVRLMLHPAFLVTLGATLLVMRLPREKGWVGQDLYGVIISWGFVWAGTFVAAALVAGRQQWLTDTDLFPGTPVSASHRVLGAIVALAGPLAVMTVLVAATALWFETGGFQLGDVPYFDPYHFPFTYWLQVVLLAALAGVLGVLVAQLRPGRWPALLVGALLIWFSSTAIWMFTGSTLTRVLHPAMVPVAERALPADFAPTGWTTGDAPLVRPDTYTSTWRVVLTDHHALAWHLGYLVGLISLAAWAAMRLADDRDRHRPLLLGGLALAVVGGVVQVVVAAA